MMLSLSIISQIDIQKPRFETWLATTPGLDPRMVRGPSNFQHQYPLLSNKFSVGISCTVAIVVRWL